MSNAFAPIVRARPDPIFGRPVHPGSPPIDYSPILLRIPFGFHLTADTLSSEARRSVAPGPSCLFPAFAFVPQKTSPYLPIASASEALPPLLDTAPLIRAPEGTLTLLTHALLSAHYGPIRHLPRPALTLTGSPLTIGLPTLVAETDFPCCALMFCHTCCHLYPGETVRGVSRSLA